MDADTDPIHPDISTTTPDENEGGTDLKRTAIERVLRLLLLLAANECTRLEIFERLALYYNVDNTTIDSDSSSRRADRMFERDIKLLEELEFEIRKIKARGKPTRYNLVKGSGPALSFLFSSEIPQDSAFPAESLSILISRR
jgi:hypothetical protein